MKKFKLTLNVSEHIFNVFQYNEKQKAIEYCLDNNATLPRKLTIHNNESIELLWEGSDFIYDKSGFCEKINLVRLIKYHDVENIKIGSLYAFWIPQSELDLKETSNDIFELKNVLVNEQIFDFDQILHVSFI